MDAEDVRTHMLETESFLNKASTRMSAYLDENNVRTIMEEDKGARASKGYMQRVFKQIRRMEVLYDEALIRVRYLLKREQFPQASAEKTLYKIYHQCILEFFSPQNDVWYEESRALYTNQASIRFCDNPPLSLKKLFAELEPDLHELREVLDYYDTKYQKNFM